MPLEAQTVKNLPSMWETQVQSLGQEDPLEKCMATHSSILAWRIPWTEEPGRLQSMGSQSRTRLKRTEHARVCLDEQDPARRREAVSAAEVKAVPGWGPCWTPWALSWAVGWVGAGAGAEEGERGLSVPPHLRKGSEAGVSGSEDWVVW